MFGHAMSSLLSAERATARLSIPTGKPELYEDPLCGGEGRYLCSARRCQGSPGYLSSTLASQAMRTNSRRTAYLAGRWAPHLRSRPGLSSLRERIVRTSFLCFVNETQATQRRQGLRSDRVVLVEAETSPSPLYRQKQSHCHRGALPCLSLSAFVHEASRELWYRSSDRHSASQKNARLTRCRWVATVSRFESQFFF